jgi:PAS domain S-box-containing protein
VCFLSRRERVVFSQKEQAIVQLISSFISLHLENDLGQDELANSLKLLEETNSLAHVGGWSLDLSSNELYWSNEVRRIHQVPDEYVPNVAEAIDFYAPEVRPQVQSVIEACIADGQTKDLELPFDTFLGNRIWVRALVKAEMNDGQATRLLGAFQDITQQHDAEETLRWTVENLDRLHKVSSQIHRDFQAEMHALLGILTQDLDFEWARVFQQEGTSADHAAWPESLSRTALRPALQALATEVGAEPPGHWLFGPHGMLAVRLCEYGGASHVLVLGGGQGAEQLTEQRSAFLATAIHSVAFALERELQLRERTKLYQHNKQLAQVAERTTSLVMITDADRLIVWVNESFEKRTGWSFEESVGKNPKILLQGEQSDLQAVSYLQEQLRAHKPACVEVVNYTKDRQPFWALLDVQPIFDAAGTLTSFVAVSTDTTEQRRRMAELEIARERAEAGRRAKEEFLAVMSHEIRTPLNGVIGNVDLLLDSSLDAAQRGLAQEVALCGESLLVLINDILDLSKIEANGVCLEARPMALQQLAEEAQAYYRSAVKEKGLRFDIESDLEVEAIIGDAVRVRQVLWNLISNAVKFTEQGGLRLRLSSARLPHDPECCQVELMVTDSGIGMDDEALKRLFEPFTQADYSIGRRFGGTGLGMTIIKRIADALGGELTVDSEPGQGSCVVLRWVAAVAMVEHESRAEDHQPVVVKPEQIQALVTEDNPVNQRLIRAALNKVPCELFLVGNGLGALQKYQEESIDIVLLDLHMPEYDGYFAAQHIRSFEQEHHRPQVPIVALTADAMNGVRDRCSACGMNDYLAKPFRLEELHDKIRYWLSAASA